MLSLNTCTIIRFSVCSRCHLLRSPRARSIHIMDSILCVREPRSSTRESWSFALKCPTMFGMWTRCSAVRFSCMPIHSWRAVVVCRCEGCGAHIGKGVRYNAEKKTVGQYFSTKILQFSMKCHLCDQVSASLSVQVVESIFTMPLLRCVADDHHHGPQECAVCMHERCAKEE